MDFSAYPNLSFKLDCGRVIKVHAFIWQPSYLERLEVKSDTKTIKRRMDIYEQFFGPCPVHVINAGFVDLYINHPPRLPNSVITLQMSSEALSGGALYSELVVELYMDHVEGLSMETILEKCLHDLDWENLAVDVSDQTEFHWGEIPLANSIN